jgi:acetolactate synthase I/II/III large subunit
MSALRPPRPCACAPRCRRRRQAAALLRRKAERPLILAGGGVHLSQAAATLQAFAEATRIPSPTP